VGLPRPIEVIGLLCLECLTICSQGANQ
jgi:hypothetical protein